ncbi:MAG: hypothetical protein K6C08_15910 [Oscillospiraceae bacterium]|nr:hypothetical protein [Oscillospiraceae bacterium]
MTAREKYADIIDLPHPVSKRHPQMALHNRAAQFSPFAALTGYDAAVAEAGRYTDSRLDITDSQISGISAKLRLLQEELDEKPEIEIRYFLPDERKPGGAYITVKSRVLKIDEYRQAVFLADGAAVPFQEIYSLEIS